MVDNPNVLLKALKIQFKYFCVDYLSLNQIKGIFSSFGFTVNHESTVSTGTRRGLVDELYDSVDWSNVDTVHNFFRLLEYILQLHDLSDELKLLISSFCEELGFVVEDNKITYIGSFFGEDLFAYQFPPGMPFGILKPDFSITAERQRQTLKYELQDGLGLLKEKVYPNFSFRMLEAFYGLDNSTNLGLKNALVEMNQTEYEKTFFLEYARRFGMANKDVPVLIPQAWIQWHSQPKRNLRSIGGAHGDELYRVDFVAFWNSKRYVILVDDISHYAVKQQSIWRADEQSYSKRLKEDRKLRRENWQVFRVSNWELRDEEKIPGILEDLRKFIGFQES
ncbi:hypothetical protein H6F85_22255 [Microcoleus sp. FACHB-45]|nr:hypothetical protein [Microcoleus sp. FACHB-84]MBD2011380.1 hypothetical protein [Microcoleus sp. FACHB-45]